MIEEIRYFTLKTTFEFQNNYTNQQNDYSRQVIIGRLQEFLVPHCILDDSTQPSSNSTRLSCSHKWRSACDLATPLSQRGSNAQLLIIFVFRFMLD